MQPQQPESPDTNISNLKDQVPAVSPADNTSSRTTEGVPRPPDSEQEQADKEQADNVPTEWPGAFGLYKFSKASVIINIWPIVGLFIVSLLIAFALQKFGGASSLLSNLSSLISFVTNSIIAALIIVLVFAGIKGQRRTASQAFENINFMLIVNYMIGLVMVMFLYFISFIALIIPFFVVFHRLLLVPYVIIDQNKDPIEAIRVSWELSRGTASLFWGIIGANTAMALLMFTIIGIPFSIYFLVMYQAAFPIAYFFLIRPSSASVAPNIAPSPVPPVA